jgi:hypothetical protein
MNRRHMIDDHHGRTAGRATLLARAMDEIFGTHTATAADRARMICACIARTSLASRPGPQETVSWRGTAITRPVPGLSP